MTAKESDRLAIVETRVEDIQGDIKRIKDNHLTSIYKKLDRFTWWLVLLLGGIIANLILQITK